jgi:hypothetical protein
VNGKNFKLNGILEEFAHVWSAEVLREAPKRRSRTTKYKLVDELDIVVNSQVDKKLQKLPVLDKVIIFIRRIYFQLCIFQIPRSYSALGGGYSDSEY